jgi:hypothetical protein
VGDGGLFAVVSKDLRKAADAVAGAAGAAGGPASPGGEPPAKRRRRSGRAKKGAEPAMLPCGTELLAGLDLRKLVELRLEEQRAMESSSDEEEAEAAGSEEDESEDVDDGSPSMLNITQGTTVEIFWEADRTWCAPEHTQSWVRPRSADMVPIGTGLGRRYEAVAQKMTTRGILFNYSDTEEVEFLRYVSALIVKLIHLFSWCSQDRYRRY